MLQGNWLLEHNLHERKKKVNRKHHKNKDLATHGIEFVQIKKLQTLFIYRSHDLVKKLVMIITNPQNYFVT